MHAVFIEVDTGGSAVDPEQVRTRLNEIAVPLTRKAGARAGFWLAPQGGRSVAVVLFGSEEEAKVLTEKFSVGAKPPAAPEDAPWTFRTVEVREVLASF